MAETTQTVKYLAEQAAAIDAAEAVYRAALADLQAACEHRTILRYEDRDYTEFRVCEDCGVTCRARWGSSVHVQPGSEVSLMGKRYYSVSWPEYARALPRTLISHDEEEDD